MYLPAVMVLQRRLDYERDPQSFCARYREEDEALAGRVRPSSLASCPQLRYTEPLLELIARLGIELEVDGHRSDIMLLKAALATAALEGATELSVEHVYTAAELVLPHRLSACLLKSVTSMLRIFVSCVSACSKSV